MYFINYRRLEALLLGRRCRIVVTPMVGWIHCDSFGADDTSGVEQRGKAYTVSYIG